MEQKHNVCGTCRWWGDNVPDCYTWRECIRDHRNTVVISEYWEVHRDFGCIFHEPRKEGE